MDRRERYRKWWEGKLCRKAHTDRPFKRVVNIVFYGPPSFFSGFLDLVFEDGTMERIAPVHAFRPRKFDVEVKEEFGLS
jgi:hypothetical protein